MGYSYRAYILCFIVISKYGYEIDRKNFFRNLYYKFWRYGPVLINTNDGMLWKYSFNEVLFSFMCSYDDYLYPYYADKKIILQ